MTLDDLRKKIVGGIHDATGVYNKVARAVPLIPTTNTVSNIVSNVGKSINSEIKALPTYTQNLQKASNTAQKGAISQVENVRQKIMSETKALPTYVMNVAKAVEKPSTTRANFDLIRTNAPKNVVGKFLANNVANAGESFFSGAHDIAEGSKMYAKNKFNPVAYVKGAMGIAKIVSPTTPFFQGSQAAQSAGQTFKIRPVERFATGLLRGQTSTEINAGMKEDKWNTPVGSFDPVVGVGSMLGFTKNPAWSKIFGVTTPINSAVVTKNPVLNYFATRSTKGSIEGGIQGMAEWDENKSISDNLKTLGSNIAFGTLSEVAMDKPSEYITKKVPEIAKKAMKFLESISMTSSQKNFASQGMVGNVRSMHPEDLTIFDQANTILNEQKRYSPKQIQEAKNYMYLFAEKYLPNRLQPEGADAKLIARRLNSRMGDGTLQTFEGGFIKPDAKIGPQTAAEFEIAAGWKPGKKAEFDLALLDGNTQKVSEMLPSVPSEYRIRFSDLINKTLNQGQPQFQQGGYMNLDAEIVGTGKAKKMSDLSPGQQEYVKLNPNVEDGVSGKQFIPKTIEQLSKDYKTPDDFISAMKSKDMNHPREILEEFYSKYDIKNQDQLEQVIRDVWSRENKPSLAGELGARDAQATEFTGFNTPVNKGMEEMAKMQSTGLPEGKYIALDKPFESPYHDFSKSTKVSVNVKSVYDPDGILGKATPEVNNQIIREANEKGLTGRGIFEKYFTSRLRELGYDSYIRNIDGQVGNRELIVFNKDNISNQFEKQSFTKSVIAPNDATNRMYELMSYGQIMRRAGYKAPIIKSTSLAKFKTEILPKLPVGLRVEYLNTIAGLPKLLEGDPKQAMGAAKALLDKGVINQDEFGNLIQMYSRKASLNPGAQTPMKQVMRDKYAMDAEDSFDSLVNARSNEEFRARMSTPNTQQTQLAKPNAEIKGQALDQADDELGRIFGDTNSNLPTSGKTGPLKDQIDRVRRELDSKYIEPSVPVYDTATKERLANSAQQRAIEDKNEFMNMFAKWVGLRDAAKTRATKTAEVLAKIPKENAWDVVKYIENPEIGANESVKKYATEVSQMYESLYKQAKNDGIDMNQLQGYITHIWKESPEQVQQKMLGLGQKFKFAKERGIPTYEEGLAMKLTPKYTNPAEIMQEYVRRLEIVKANRDFFENLKKVGLVVDASVGGGHSAFQPIVGQGFPQSISSTNGNVVTGSYYAPREVAEIINRVFNPQEANKILQKTAWASGKMQDILMSGGIPKSPVNAWSLAQLTKEVHAGRITRPVVSFIRSFSGDASNKFFSDNAGQIIKMQERNIPISSTYNVSSMVDKPVLNKVFGDGWGDVWSKVTNEPTFKRFMPQLQVSLFNDIESGALKAGKTPGEAADIAAQAVRNFYAVRTTNSAVLSNPNTEALKTTFFFAPSYRETMIKFWLNNIKSILPAHIKQGSDGIKIALNNPLSAQNINNTRFVIGSVLALSAYNKLNEYFNDGKNMLQNPRGREDQLLIPLSKITGNKDDNTVIGIPWLSSIAYMPRTAFKIAKSLVEGDFQQVPRQAKGFLSTALRPMADVVTNEDYFQNEIYGEGDAPTEKWKKTGDYLFKQYGLQHPYIKTGYEALQGKIKSPFELAAKATELPLRFTTQDKIKSQYYYQNRDDVLKGLTEEERNAFNSLPKKAENETESQTAAETRIKYNTYVRYPAVLEAQKEIAIRSANGDMTKVDPLYALDSDQLKYFAAYTAATPGSYERRNILAEAPWIKEFQGVRSEYFDRSSRERIATDLSSGEITQLEADAKIKELDDNKLKYSSGTSTGSGKKKITIKKVAAIKKGKNTAKVRTIKLKKVARSMITKGNGVSSIPHIRIKKSKPKTIANKFRVVIRKAVS